MQAKLGYSERSRYLAATAELLWPEPATVTVGRAVDGHVVSEFFVLPSIADARLVLPLRDRRAAAAVAHRYAEPRTFVRKVRAYAMSVATATGVAQAVFRDRIRIAVPHAAATAPLDTIETLLSEVLGRHAVVGMHVTTPRANRKPVLQALATDGTLQAIAKVATDDLTRTLVAAEERNLRHLATHRLRTFEIPRVLDLREWRGLFVLTMSALPVHASRAPTTSRQLTEVVTEIAATAPLVEESLARSRYVRRLRARLGELRAPYADVLQCALQQLLDDHGERSMRFGAWHGDFTHTNLAVLPDRLLVWDWERYESPVPVGYDLLHLHAQQAVHASGADVSAGVRTLMQRAPGLLASLRLGPADATALSKLYLVEIVTRYVADRQDERGRLRTVLPVLLDVVATVCRGDEREG